MMRTTTIAVVATNDGSPIGKFAPHISFTGEATAKDIADDCEAVSNYLTMATFDEESIQRHLNSGAIVRTETSLNSFIDLDLQGAAHDMLTAFAEGVVWNDHQREAYTKLAMVLNVKVPEEVECEG